MWRDGRVRFTSAHGGTTLTTYLRIATIHVRTTWSTRDSFARKSQDQVKHLTQSRSPDVSVIQPPFKTALNITRLAFPQRWHHAVLVSTLSIVGVVPRPKSTTAPTNRLLEYQSRNTLAQAVQKSIEPNNNRLPCQCQTPQY